MKKGKRIYDGHERAEDREVVQGFRTLLRKVVTNFFIVQGRVRYPSLSL